MDRFIGPAASGDAQRLCSRAEQVPAVALAPESDEEKVEQARGEETQKEEPQKVAPKKKPLSVAIDFAEIDQRIIALPIPAHNFIALVCAKLGTIYLL